MGSAARRTQRRGDGGVEGLIGFFVDNAWILFFANGLGFFILGLAIGLELRRASTFPMGQSLWLLSVYGFSASLGNWLQMSLFIQAQAVPLGGPPLEHALKLLLFVLAALSLLQFSVRLIVSRNSRLRWLQAGFWVLVAIYAGVLLVVLFNSRVSGGDWIASAEVWARYLLHFPALALAGISFLQRGGEWPGIVLYHNSRDRVGAGIAFLLKMMVSGLAAVPILGFSGPALSTWVLLLQFTRTLTTGAIAYFVVRMLRAAEVHRQRQLDEAVAQRFEAQEHALQVQQQACDEIQQWSSSMADMMYSISLAISQLLPLQETLRMVLQETIKLSGLQSGGVWLLDQAETTLELAALQGLPDWMTSHLSRVPVGAGLAGWVAQTEELLVIDDITDDPRPFVPRSAEFVRSVVGIPLKAGGQTLGVMNLSSMEPHKLTKQQVALLTAAGHQLGVAIKAAMLSQRIRYLATTEERSRLSREIHDNLAQLLGYLNLKAASAVQSLADGSLEETHDTLLEVKRIAQQAYADARETIFSLRAPTLDADFFRALEEYLDEYWAHYGIQAELSTEDPSLVSFSPDVGIQVSCIIQEALANVRKHAQASKVWLSFEPHEQAVQITIEDDGQGFDLEQVTAQKGLRFGILIMRERAEGVGGSLDVESHPGKGTRVIVQVPRVQGSMG